MDDAAIELVQFSMTLEAHKQSLSALNVARANVAGSTEVTADFRQLLDQLAEMEPAQRNQAIDVLSQSTKEVLNEFTSQSQQPVALDEAVAQSLLASGKFQGLAEGLSRKFGLMELALGMRK